MTATITIRADRTRPIACGHPWIFSGAIAETSGNPTPERLVRVVDTKGEELGLGLYSPHSQIRVRMLAAGADVVGDGLDESALTTLIGRAAARRRATGLPSEQTTGYRLINSEGDGLPGLIADRYEDLIVLQLTTLPMVERREAIVGAFRAAFPDRQLAIREVRAPKRIADLEGFRPFDGWHGEAQPERVEFAENGVRYAIDTAQMQKTGHYADMRIHRAWVAGQAAGCRVLDAYAYTGAFGLNAAARGASAVVCVDSGEAAAAQIAVNRELGGYEGIEIVHGKVEDYLRSAYDRGVRFDVIVLDPPKLAPTRRHTNKALKVYESLVVQALRLLEPGGLFCLGSCSEAIGESELERVLSVSMGRTGRRLGVVYSGTQSPDHPYPAGMSEGRYLTFVAAREIG